MRKVSQCWRGHQIEATNWNSVFKTSLERFNLYSIKPTHCQCGTQWSCTHRAAVPALQWMLTVSFLSRANHAIWSPLQSLAAESTPIIWVLGMSGSALPCTGLLTECNLFRFIHQCSSPIYGWMMLCWVDIHILFIPSSADGQLGCFRLAIMSSPNPLGKGFFIFLFLS
jgi:hypothetical protein